MNSPYKGKFKVSQIFKGSKHKGMDLVGLTSKNIYSTVNGTVEAARRDVNPNAPNDKNYGMGNYIRIKDDATGYRFYFAHLSKILVKQGQKVKKDDLIGAEGSTGHSTGSHLHYEVRKIPDNTTFMDISQFIGIPNVMATYTQDEQEEEEVQTQKITASMNGKDTPLTSILYNNENYVRLRDLADAQTDDKLNVNWDAAKKKVVITSR